MAAIVTRITAPDQTRLEQELRALCREHLARYEVPQCFEFVKQLPRSPLGKLLKYRLRDAATDGAAAEPAGDDTSGQEAQTDKESGDPKEKEVQRW